MSMLRHIMSAPFVFATGLAALVHSTWSLGTLMSGTQPKADLSIEFIGWLVPALLIAFALDVGQIATSADIRQYGMNRARGATFIIFAGATYYLQWLYMSHHMPALPLADGIRASWGDFATLMRDAAVWIVPMLLPLSTLLYTFSDDRHTHERAQHHDAQHVAMPASDVVVMPIADDSPALPFDDDILMLNQGLTVEVEQAPRPTQSRSGNGRRRRDAEEAMNQMRLDSVPTVTETENA